MKLRLHFLGFLCLLLILMPDGGIAPRKAYASAVNAATTSADLNISSSGDNTVIAAVAGKKIIVWKIWLVSGGAVNLTFKDGTTALNAGTLPLTGNGSSIFFPFDSEPYWTTSSGNAFVINLSGAVQVTGRIYYTVSQ